MRPLPELSAVIEEIHQWVLTAPSRQRRLRSNTFWDKFRYKARTQERVAAVKEALANKGIQILQPPLDTFGAEDRGDWIVLATGELLPPRPTDNWFQKVVELQFESEREVDSFFVIPVLEQLGYTQPDMAQGFWFYMNEGSTRRHRQADFAIFDGPNRTNTTPLLVVESKNFGQQISAGAVSQARSYALWLNAPYYMVTNADEIQLFENPGLPQSQSQVMVIKRAELQVRWNEFAGKLHRAAVIVRKAQIADSQRTQGAAPAKAKA